LASNADSPEYRALAELERAVGHLMEELATWRRRALRAEAHRTDLGSGHDVVGSRERIVELAGQNAELTARLAAGRERVEHLLGRLQFLEDQLSVEERR
jgi:hypothetical protein